MGVSHSTAKWLAPTSLLFNFAAQLYGLLSSPNLKDVNDENPSFFTPMAAFIGVIFFSQLLSQAAFIYKLWKLDPQRNNEAEKHDAEIMAAYVPYCAISNICIGVWVPFWNASALKLSNLFVCISTLAQLYYVISKLPVMDRASTPSRLLHVVSKSFAALGVLDTLHNTSIAYMVNQPASTLIRILTGVGFGLASAASDWIFGGLLVYDLVALAAGQSGSWRMLLGAYAVGAAVIVTAKNTAK